MRTSAHVAIAIACALSFARVGIAQTVRGTVVSESGAAVSGVVLLLVDSAGATARRTLSDERGAFVLAAPAPGRYGLRTLRIGFRPAELGPFVLRAGRDTAVRITLRAAPVSLARVVVTARRGACGARTDSATAAAALWNAVRSALEAQEATASAHRYEMRFVSRERRYDADGTTLRDASRAERQGATQRAFASLSADSLALLGYVTPANLVTSAGVEFRGPDALVLLSERFAHDHCFDVVASSDPEQRLVGLAFRPARSTAPGTRADVRGTLWIDRLTSELRRIEFAYEGLPAEARRIARGRVEYLRLPTGGWIIRDWEIRMPVLRDASVRRQQSLMGPTELVRRVEVDAVHAAGGAVIDVLAGGRMVWTARTARLAGVVRGVAPSPALRVTLTHVEGGSPRHAGVDATGRFVIDSIEPDAHRLLISGDPVDSLGLAADTVRVTPRDGATTSVELRAATPHAAAARLCGRAARDTSERAIVGRVLAASGAPRTDALVRASYLARARIVADRQLVGEMEKGETRTGDGGRLLLCGLPPDRPIELRVTTRDGASVTTSLRLRPERGYEVVELRVGR